MIEPIMHWFLGSQCVAYTMCRKIWDVVDDPNDSTHCGVILVASSLLMLSMLLCHCGWLMLPTFHLIVCLLFLVLWFIVVSLIALVGMKLCN